MSFHIYVQNNTALKISDVLENSYLPKDAVIAYGKDAHESIGGYTKLYLPLKSSRGVVIATYEEEYDVQINTGGSEADYYLATRIALALSMLNNSTIIPEFDYDLTAEEFEKKYDHTWAKESETLGMSALTYMITKEGSTVQLGGCKRAFYVGQKMLDRLATSNRTSEKEMSEFIVSNMIQLQFIEDLHEDIEVPTLMEGDFPEGTKSFIFIASNFQLLLTKADLIMLREEENMVKVPYQELISTLQEKGKLRRVDEEQFVMQPLKSEEYKELMQQFSEEKNPKEKPKKSNRKWKFW
ncbi:MAG: hypothetical protein AAF611_20090 [Bacteroidota bacterium]